MLYFDHNATTPVRPAVLDLVGATARDTFGNPSSQHSAGRKARALLEESRERLAALLSVRPSEIVFTSGGTEANRLAIFGAIARGQTGVPHALVSAIEHPSVLEVSQSLGGSGRVNCELVAPGENGRVPTEAFIPRLRPETRLLSLHHANNETGVLQDISALAQGLERWRTEIGSEALLHVDAVQTFGKVPLSPTESGADLVTLSSHKLGGPRGAGALWVKSGCSFAAPFAGGPQERRLRPGTEDLPAIVGFVHAAELSLQALASGAPWRFDTELEARLRATIGDIEVNGDPSHRLANTLNVSFTGVPAELLVIRLDQDEVSVSTGSACASGSREPSHVLRAMGCSPQRTESAIRFSSGWNTTPAELEELSKRVRRAVEDLRAALGPAAAEG